MEGPSLVILREELAPFIHKKVVDVSGNTREQVDDFCSKTICDIESWGKQLLVEFDKITLRIHFLMFGSYRVNERREGMNPRLSLKFKNGEINFYNCSVKIIRGALDDIYDWTADVLSPRWLPSAALKKVRARGEDMICDVLMDQNIFAGVGNIIKNEILFRQRVNPLAVVRDLPLSKLRALVADSRKYSQLFYKWRKKFELKKHWQMYRKSNCPVCETKVIRTNAGRLSRRSFYCPVCQRL